MFLILIEILIDWGAVGTIAAIAAIAVSIVLAFVGATVLEKRRQETIRTIEEDALRDALYSEMAWIIRMYARLTRAAETPSTQWDAHVAEMSWAGLKKYLTGLAGFDVFAYTREHPTVFYRLDDAYVIERFYQYVQYLLARLDAYESSKKGLDIEAFMREEMRETLLLAMLGLDIDKLEDVTTGKMNDLLKKKGQEEREKEAMSFINKKFGLT